MELPKIFRPASIALLLGLSIAPQITLAQDVTNTVTLRIGAFPEVHTVPVAAYQALVSQGVETHVISASLTTRAAAMLPFALPQFQSQPATATATGAAPLTMTGWAVGVFR